MSIPAHTRVVFAVWFGFLARGAFYCLLLPLWEGYDEWAHFAYVQHLAEHWSLPDRASSVSVGVQKSLLLTPLSRSAAADIPGAITHDEFWSMSEPDRSKRVRELAALHAQGHDPQQVAGRARQYEAQQPPLYHLAMSVPYVLTMNRNLPAQVLALRLASLLIASTVILSSYALARELDFSRSLALFVPLLIACLPGFYINVCRVGNECLSAALAALITLQAVRLVKRPFRLRGWLVLAVLFGAALLTKAYFLAFLPVLMMCVLLHKQRWPDAVRRTVGAAALTAVLVASSAGWWYARVWSSTGTLSGEQLDASVAHRSMAHKLAAIAAVDWATSLDTGAFSHIWVGGWSFLVARSWMYRAVEAIAFLAALGLAIRTAKWASTALRDKRGLAGNASPIVIPALAFGCMVAAMAYHSVVVFLSQNVSTVLGWYMYAVVVPEVILVCIGLSALVGTSRIRPCMAFVCCLAVLLDVYTVHLKLMPYYTGFLKREPSGSIGTLALTNLPHALDPMFAGLATNKPAYVDPSVIESSWVCYQLATVVLLGIAMMACTRRGRAYLD